jgi:hypothetical protein
MILSFPFLTASFDSDARAFVNTSGATDRAAINYFVKGMKRLGLWSSMVCWPLRSSQNAGTGSTAYSLGGLGTYNGTLVNGPTWGADGVTKANANEIINVNGTDATLRESLSVFSCYKSNVTADNQRTFNCHDGSSAGNYWQSNLNTNSSKQAFIFCTRNSTNSSSSVSDVTGRETLFNYWGAALAPTSSQAIFNGSVLAEQTGLAARNPIGTPNVEMLGTNGASNARGTLSFAVALVPTISSANSAALYAIYKATLGQGLGLP